MDNPCCEYPGKYRNLVTENAALEFRCKSLESEIVSLKEEIELLGKALNAPENKVLQTLIVCNETLQRKQGELLTIKEQLNTFSTVKKIYRKVKEGHTVDFTFLHNPIQ